MTTISKATREICAKIVYYGPGLSGKTTSLKRVYESIRAANRGEMISLTTEGERTLFFDFLPITVEKLGDCNLRLALYTVPGQVFYNATRKLVLQNADGVVFVADSQRAAMDNNVESMENLHENLREMGLDPAQHPLVIQYNKRDTPDAATLAEMRQRLNPHGVPDFETIAERGEGVLEALRAITRQVIKSLRSKGATVGGKPRKAAAGPTPALALEKREESSPLALQLEQAASRAVQTEVHDPSLMSALVPGAFAGEAALAEADYRAGLYKESFGRTLGALRALSSGLGPQGMGEVERALLAGLSGQDYARLLRAEKAAPGRDEAAFGLLMLALAGTRSKD